MDIVFMYCIWMFVHIEVFILYFQLNSNNCIFTIYTTVVKAAPKAL